MGQGHRRGGGGGGDARTVPLGEVWEIPNAIHRSRGNVD